MYVKKIMPSATPEKDCSDKTHGKAERSIGLNSLKAVKLGNISHDVETTQGFRGVERSLLRKSSGKAQGKTIW